jgi:acid stress-induced BolA-like protein IbaG/YrbA
VFYVSKKMNSEDVTTLLEKTLAGCQIEVDSQGSHFNVLVVGDLFKGKRAVQRQQLIYAVLNESIASGAIHAVNMKLFTPQEWLHRTQ